MFKKIAIAMAVATAMAGVASNAVAGGSVTPNLTVQATVTSKCTASTTAVNIGAYDPVSTNSATGADKQGQGTIVVTCTKNANGVTIGLDLGGNNAGAGPRAMTGGTNGDKLLYDLYKPSAATANAACAFTTVWGNSGGALFTPSATWGATASSTFNICGQANKGQDVSGTSAGESYTDTVIATVTF